MGYCQVQVWRRPGSGRNALERCIEKPYGKLRCGLEDVRIAIKGGISCRPSRCSWQVRFP